MDNASAVIKQEPPAHVRADQRMLEIWKRSHHILPPEAFEPEVAHVVLLPIVSKRLKKEAAALQSIIESTPGLNMKQLSESSGIRYGRCRTILRFRDKLEWRLSKEASAGVLAYPLEDDRLARLIPNENEIRVEYLVAELERAGFDLRVELWPGNEQRLAIHQARAGGPDWFPGLMAYIVQFHEDLRTYIKRRDGLSAPRVTFRDSR